MLRRSRSEEHRNDVSQTAVLQKDANLTALGCRSERRKLFFDQIISRIQVYRAVDMRTAYAPCTNELMANS